ncbi:FtsX-like permease family protein [Plantactinospora soyae]|uniref:ABC transport system permease protein n=1 Tax=Plantactinospora soyae TaxID=1544732 RepID=A0A927M9A4_9ACTN|nr:FtsX-like permease family protein [Plantactinospora soyae]MBE1489432.1 putative ABC transport system permease protein [Plantactinospora soyae]
MRVLPIALREFRSNWRRNTIFGAILLISVVVQLFTALASTASRTAVETYGTAVFGYAETYTMSLADPLTPERLAAFNDELALMGQSYPWFRPATAVDLSGFLRVSPDSAADAATPVTIRAVTSGWRRLTAAIPDDDVWRTVTSDRRLSAAVLVEQGTAQRLGVTGPMAVTVLLDAERGDSAGGDGEPGSDVPGSGLPTPSATEATDGGGPDGGGPAPNAPPAEAAGPVGHRTTLPDVPVFGSYAEPNKSLAVDALVSQNVLALGGLGPQTVQVYWRCVERECRDTYRLVELAAATVGARPGREQRIDQLDQFGPVLRQQDRDGQRFALVVLVLGALAVAIVSSAFVEVRAPQFATLRALGASRSGIAAIALLENLFTSALVGSAAVLLGLAATGLDPNSFNQIPQVRLTQLAVPIGLYAQTIALTLLIGLLTGLAPAVRAYRSVRTS